MATGLSTNLVNTNAAASVGDTITGFAAGTKVMFDKGAQLATEPRVIKTQFGDGYEMRVRDGINNTPRQWSLAFNNRTNDDIDNLFNFFNKLASVDTCQLTVPDSVGGEETVKVVVEGYNKTYAQMDPEEKNKTSHRAKALNKLNFFLQNYFNNRASPLDI